MPGHATGLEEWTAERVCDRLIACFRALPTTGIYSPQLNGLVQGSPVYVRDITPLEFIQLTARYIPRRADRLAVLTWARAKAGIGAPAVAEACRELGWPKSTFERRRRAAAAIIAAGLNADVAAGDRARSLLVGASGKLPEAERTHIQPPPEA
jgi:hypothetical protein